jgi:crotonobetainyl-CoA:carnitine CoA-transferase CaiB-like acyl-CoA transferase
MKPLEGVKVVELTAFLAAPTVGRVLGEWGADVIKIEPPAGDPGRTQGAVFNMPYTDDENLGFDISNANKRFITLNLKTEAGKKVAYQLLEKADVLITSYRTKALVKLGFNWEELHKRFPKLVFAQVMGYGEKGPEKDSAGFDATAYVCRGGILGTTLERGGDPINSVNGFGDFQVSMCLAGGICAALVGRNQTGKGDKVTISLHHTALFMMNIAVLSAQYGNKYPKSRKDVVNPFNNIYKSKDGRWLVVCVPEYDRLFDKFMTVIGRSDLCGNAELSTMEAISKNDGNAKVIKIIAEQLEKFTLDEIDKKFRDADFAHEKGYVPEEILQDEQAWATDALRKIHCDSGNERIFLTNPIRMESIGDPEIKLTKKLSYHTDSVLQGLGYSQGDIDKMRSEKVIV